MSNAPPNNQSHVKVLFRGVKSSALNFESFRDELKMKNLSGELVIHNGNLSISLLFLDGLPAVDSRRLGVKKTLTLMRSPAAILDFFALGYNLTQAYVSTMNGEQVWDSSSVSRDQVKKVLAVTKKKQITGHLSIHSSEGAIHQLFIQNGKPLGLFTVENNWERTEPAQALKNGLKMELFITLGPDEFIVQNPKKPVGVVPPVEKKPTLYQDIDNFLPCFNNFTSQLVDKVGSGLVSKSLKKHFSTLALVSVKDLKLHNSTPSGDVGSSDDYDVFRQAVQHFIQAMVDISGKQWMRDRLADCAEEHTNALKCLDLIKIFSV